MVHHNCSEHRQSSGSTYSSTSDRACHRLFLRVFAAEGVSHVSAIGAYCKLYVSAEDWRHGSCSLFRQKDTTATRVFKTSCVEATNPIWNEKFQVKIPNPAIDKLTVRVKIQRRLYAPSIGSIMIPVATLERNQTVDQWFDLTHIGATAGRIRLQLHLQAPTESSTASNQLQHSPTINPLPYIHFQPSEAAHEHYKTARFGATASNQDTNLTAIHREEDKASMPNVTTTDSRLYARLSALDDVHSHDATLLHGVGTGHEYRGSSLCEQAYINPPASDRPADLVVLSPTCSIYCL